MIPFKGSKSRKVVEVRLSYLDIENLREMVTNLHRKKTKNRISHKIILGEYYQKLLIRENNKIIQNYETLFLHK